MFVSVGYEGFIYRSTNGIDWQSQTPLLYNNIYGVTYGNGLFVAVGDNTFFTTTTSNIFTSPDGITWTAHDCQPTQTLNAVAYGGGCFVALGTAGGVFTSVSGDSWYPTSLSGITMNAGAPVSIIYANGQFLASYESTTNLAIDFNNIFEPVRKLDSGTAVRFGRLVYAAGVYLATGYSTPLNTNAFLTSTDGTNWVQRGFQSAVNVSGITFDGHRFFAVGDSGHPDQIVFPTLLKSDAVVDVGLTFNSSPNLVLSGLTGRSYRIDYFDGAFLNGSNNWQSLATFSLPASPYSWTDPTATNSPSRFYRAVLLP